MDQVIYWKCICEVETEKPGIIFIQNYKDLIIIQ